MDETKTKKIEKKKKIIETAYQLFKNAGISATAIDDVVKAAGIARGTFYLYFKDKSDLLEQLVFYKSTETMKTLLRQAGAELTAGQLDFLSMVRRFVEIYIRFYADHRDVMMVLNKNMTSFLRSFPVFYDAEAQAIYDQILQYFVDYGYTEEKANRMIYIVIEMLGSVCADAILYGKPFSLEELESSLASSAVLLIENGVSM